ncbi:MAG: NAD(P)H-hydrate dehydratase, partial [Gammaproteobacteria bacterium]
AIAIGPGLGQTDWSKQLLQTIIDVNLPIVLDADALNLLPSIKKLPHQFILTPHPGEAARLLNSDMTTIQLDRVAAVVALHKKYGGTIVLKGKNTLICDTLQQLSECPYGNPGMATAGMGDILTGVIVGLIAQGLNLTEAAQLGVCIHALAGDHASKQGERGLIATDLLPHLRTLANANTY